MKMHRIFVGVITQIKSDKYISFLTNGSARIRIEDVVSIDNGSGVYVNAIVESIQVKYFLENPSIYFLSGAVDDNLEKITSSSKRPRYALEVEAKIIGFYKQNESGQLIPIDDSINKYTALPLEKVYLFENNKMLSVYGLHEQGFKLGNVIFPDSFDALVAPEKFRNHTLVTGVTGAGKSRFVASLIKNMAVIGSHIIIIDPHDEYTELLASNDNDFSIKRIARDPYIRNRKIIGKNVAAEKLAFSSEVLTAQTLCSLLPNLSKQQEEQINLIFNAVYENPNQRNINSLLNYINEKRKAYEPHRDKDKPTIYDVYRAISDKMTDAYNLGLFEDGIIGWLDKNKSCIDIFVGDHKNDDFGNRFIGAILQQLSRVASADYLRLLVIEEGHQLFSIKNSLKASIIEQALREARKFKTSILFVSQNEFDLPDSIRSQFQNTIKFREQHNKDTCEFHDRICYVSLKAAKSRFIMRSNKFLKIKEKAVENVKKK